MLLARNFRIRISIIQMQWEVDRRGGIGPLV